MRNYLKYLVRAVIAFSPSIFLWLGVATGLIEYEGQEFDALSTAVALVQAIVLAPFIVWMWVDFRRHPEKYPAPGWLMRVLDVLPLGFVLFAILYFYFDRV